MRSWQQAVEEVMRLHQEGKLDQAERGYDQLLQQMQTPDPNVFFGLGSLLVAQQKYGIGTTLLRTGISIYDKHPLPHCNLGVAYRHMGRDDLALAHYNKALALDPAMPEVLAGLGGFYTHRDEAKVAEDYCRRALAIDPDLQAGRQNLAVALLEQGRFEEAWPYWEARWDSLDRSMDRRPYKAPRWKGENVQLLAIHGEQGLGDEILFMSLINKAKARANRIIVECADRLIPLFSNSFNVPCYPDHQSLMAEWCEPDAYIPMGSLPMVLGLPDGKPFLRRSAVMTRTSDRPIIGVTWRGGTAKTNANDRTIKIGDLHPILTAIDADFVSLQYGGDDVDLDARSVGVEPGDRGFDALVHRTSLCDLVITVCQTAVHIAGGMGIDTWVLTPRKAAWRYCGDDMRPWYNSVTLFRQETAGEWEPVILQIAAKLKERYAARAA